MKSMLLRVRLVLFICISCVCILVMNGSTGGATVQKNEKKIAIIRAGLNSSDAIERKRSANEAAGIQDGFESLFDALKAAASVELPEVPNGSVLGIRVEDEAFKNYKSECEARYAALTSIAAVGKVRDKAVTFVASFSNDSDGRTRVLVARLLREMTITVDSVEALVALSGDGDLFVCKCAWETVSKLAMMHKAKILSDREADLVRALVEGALKRLPPHFEFEWTEYRGSWQTYLQAVDDS